MIDVSKWPKLRVPGEEATAHLRQRISEGESLSTEKIISAGQLDRLLERAAVWRASNTVVLRQIFDPLAGDDYEKKEWEDLLGQDYAERYILRRIRELVTGDLTYLTVLKSYIADIGGRAIAEASLVSTPPLPPPYVPRQASESVSHTNQTVVDVFVSHSNVDVAIATALVSLIRAALPITPGQIRCTSVEGYKLPIGAVTDDHLRVEIYQATTFVGLITASSMESAYVLFELGARWAVNKHLAPLLAAGATPSSLRGPLKRYNALSCSSAADLHQFLRNLGEQLKVRVEPPSAYQRELESLIGASASAKPA